jgi:hypothetical protein
MYRSWEYRIEIAATRERRRELQRWDQSAGSNRPKAANTRTTLRYGFRETRNRVPGFRAGAAKAAAKLIGDRARRRDLTKAGVHKALLKAKAVHIAKAPPCVKQNSLA